LKYALKAPQVRPGPVATPWTRGRKNGNKYAIAVTFGRKMCPSKYDLGYTVCEQKSGAGKPVR
jgi:hypothetical protein